MEYLHWTTFANRIFGKEKPAEAGPWLVRLQGLSYLGLASFSGC